MTRKEKYVNENVMCCLNSLLIIYLYFGFLKIQFLSTECVSEFKKMKIILFKFTCIKIANKNNLITLKMKDITSNM